MNVEKRVSEKSLGEIKIVKNKVRTSPIYPGEITLKPTWLGHWENGITRRKRQHAVRESREHSSFFTYFCFRMVCGLCMKTLGKGIDWRFVSEFLPLWTKEMIG